MHVQKNSLLNVLIFFQVFFSIISNKDDFFTKKDSLLLKCHYAEVLFCAFICSEDKFVL